MTEFVDWLRLANAAYSALILLAMCVRWRHWIGLQLGRKILRLALAMAILTALVGAVQGIAFSTPIGPAVWMVTATLLATTAGLIADDPPKKETP